MNNMKKLIFSEDLVGLVISGQGMIVTPASAEPVPEDHERVSHLRISRSSNVLTNDFHRSFFKVISENQVPFFLFEGCYSSTNMSDMSFVL